MATPVTRDPSAARSPRNLGIDTLRGLACVLLVFYHVVGLDEHTGLGLDSTDPLRQLNEALTFLRMPLFAFLTGVVHAQRPITGLPGQLVLGKARRLLVPLLTVGSLYAVLKAVLPGPGIPHFNWATLHIVPVAHYWFLESLFLIFLLLAAVERRHLKTERGLVLAMLGAALLHGLNPLPFHLGLYGAGYLLPFVLLGIWVQRFGLRFTKANMLALSAAAGLFLAALPFALGWPWPLRGSFLSLALGASACVFLYRLQTQVPALAWLGMQAFAVYLFHSFFTAGSRMVLRKLGFADVGLLSGAGLLAGLLGPIALAHGLRRLRPWGFWLLGERPEDPARWARSNASV